MRLQRGFTLLELLIALSLSTFVIMGLLQSNRSLMRYMARSRAMINTNRKVCLLFNQLERDFTTAFIPVIHKEVNPEKEKQKEKEDPKKQLSKTEKKKAEEKEREELKKFFLGESGEVLDFVKIDGNKLIPFKSVTFINTNPLQIYGKKRVRFVRVKYELVKNKQRSKGEKISYNLIRKETQEIENFKMKIDEFDHEKQKTNPIRTHVVADNVKNMFIEYVTVKKQKNKDKKVKKHEKQEEVRSFVWGDKDQSKGVVPQRVEVRVSFWNDALTSDHSFQVVFPIFSYPTQLEKEKSEKEKSEKEEASKEEVGEEEKKNKEPFVGGSVDV